MIITVNKPLSEILEGLKPYKNVFVVGCAACATKCQTGGEEAVKFALAELEKAGKKVAGSVLLDTPCDSRIVKKDLSKSPHLKTADAVLVLACGAGVGALENIIEKPLVPGLNPVFVGTTERIGQYNELCAVCGNCIAGKTGGICPVSRCAKGLVNGPCGGVIDGKCETDTTRDCAWVLILDKLKKSGKEADIINNYFPPRKTAKPRQVKFEARNKR
jgi:ferredoxin